MKECFDFSSIYQITDKMVESGLFTELQVESVERALKAEELYEQLLFDFVRAKTGHGDETRKCFDIQRGYERRKGIG